MRGYLSSRNLFLSIKSLRDEHKITLDMWLYTSILPNMSTLAVELYIAYLRALKYEKLTSDYKNSSGLIIEDLLVDFTTTQS